MQDPLKQGLKLCRYVLVDRLKNIRMQDPLKQGLKRTVEFPIRIWFLIIRMQDPLKQGLKPKSHKMTREPVNLFECKIH